VSELWVFDFSCAPAALSFRGSVTLVCGCVLVVELFWNLQAMGGRVERPLLQAVLMCRRGC